MQKYNILIICSFFPPDSSIAAKRPYFLAKYLAEMGHSITVLRSGEIHRTPDNTFPELNNVMVISFMGLDSDAEKFKRGEYASWDIKPQNRKKWLPESVKKTMRSIYDFIMEPVNTNAKLKEANRRFAEQKKTLEQLCQTKKYDIVFSTYSNLENIYAGEYAAKLFKAIWIQDFRDPVTAYHLKSNYFWNHNGMKIQKHTFECADLCTTVSDGMTSSFRRICPHANIRTLYNGYEESEENVGIRIETDDHLIICYTGIFYQLQIDVISELSSVLKRLIESNQIDKKKITLRYAGPESKVIQDVFEKNNLGDIIADYGYVSREKAKYIQDSSDIFLVLSWNTKDSQGVLTGKFYEGIRANKPILALVAGELPNSELYQMNEKFHYGYCFEIARKHEMENELEQFILKYYNQKINNKKIDYEGTQQLKQTFRYDYIAEKLNQYIELEMENRNKR